MQEELMEYAERYFFTPTAFEKAGAVWPIRLGRNVAKPHYRIGPRTTTYYSLHFVLEGTGTYIQDNRSYDLQRNDLFCLFPNRSHEYFTSDNHPLQMAWIAFDGKKALSILERLGMGPAVPFVRNAIRPGVRELIDAFFDLIRAHGRKASDFAKLIAFYSVFEALSENPAMQEKGSGESSGGWLQKGVEYLEMHYAEGITIEKAASFVGVDRAYFSRKFNAAYGMSPIKYLQNLKMKAACTMLADTAYTLTEIAFSVGYHDLFSFSKAFKKHFHMSPSEFRQSDPSSMKPLTHLPRSE
ncbi:AraC family transcriptional regulator [Paenibacillus hemerocallicola]|uniref:AraC family transcriptional regulator n=1 Tax=Paenibacillus hemerocallicola TaxID=1172614 RepID=A0A5C4TC32_9BACL|nr:AraC family transcriptional regulator [Paenibacillus hemerocallicola]TNJ66019.1 AraC family transcriptional regulator [Paenibacillus hemerocallicola]